MTCECPAPGDEDLRCTDCEPAWSFDGTHLYGPTGYYDVEIVCAYAHDWTAKKDGREVVALPDEATALLRAHCLADPEPCGECDECGRARREEVAHRLDHAAGRV